MESTRAPEQRKSESGVALFMVLSAVATLALLVTEFTYVSQINQKIAYDALDQVKSHYLAKSAFKISLLRLKAYSQVKGFVGKEGAALGGAIPRQIVEKIWSFPFFYPFPTNVPGMTPGDKERVEKFQKASALEGSFSATIESESGKLNLNMLLAPFVPKVAPSPAPSGAPSPTPGPPKEFDGAEAQKSLTEFLSQILNNKFEADRDFADEYSDLKVEDLTSNIRAWVDPRYERPYVPPHESVGLKRGPFSSLSELRMITLMTDELYDLFAPTLTVSSTPGINVNSMNEITLRALVPGITKEESDEFFKFRDSQEEDHSFKKPEDFFQYVGSNFAAYRGQNAADQLKSDLEKRNIRLVVDETQFKITVQAKVNQSIRLLEAWVTLLDGAAGDKPPGGGPRPAPSPVPGEVPPQDEKSGRDSGLKVTFMRIS